MTDTVLSVMSREHENAPGGTGGAVCWQGGGSADGVGHAEGKRCDDVIHGAFGGDAAAHQGKLAGAPGDGGHADFAGGDFDLGAFAGADFVTDTAEGEVGPEGAALGFEADDAEREVDVADERFEAKDVASDTNPHYTKAFAAAEDAEPVEFKVEGGVAHDRFAERHLDGGQLLLLHFAEELQVDVCSGGLEPTDGCAAVTAHVFDDGADGGLDVFGNLTRDKEADLVRW